MKSTRRYDEVSGKAEVVVFDDGLVGRGLAYLHEDDREFGNKSTGVSIAEYRAMASIYFKKAIKELDTIIYISNRYKNNKITADFCNMLEARADKYMSKAMSYSFTADEVVETKDMFYRRMEGLRSGEISTMQFFEDLSEVLGDDFKAAIDAGMEIEIPETENENREVAWCGFIGEGGM